MRIKPKCSIQEIINGQAAKLDDKINRLKRQKLEEVKLQKELLQRRIENLDESIKYLDHSELKESSPKFRKTVETEEEVERKKKEFRALAKKLQREKDERKYLKEKDELDHQLKLIAEAEEYKRLEQARADDLKLAKQKQLEDLQAKKLQRRHEMEITKLHFLDKTPETVKPKFVIMEEKYKNEIEMPELERRKLELAKKRQKLGSVGIEEIAEHAKIYKEIAKEAQIRRDREKIKRGIDNTVYNYTSPTKASKINYESEAPDEKMRREHDEKVKKSEKIRRYGEIVKELFYPTIDENKRAEMLKAKQQVNLPKILKPVRDPDLATFEKLNKSTDAIHSTPQTERKQKRAKKIRKISVNSRTPDIKEKTVDYLAERRALKAQLDNELHRLFEKQHVT